MIRDGRHEIEQADPITNLVLGGLIIVNPLLSFLPHEAKYYSVVLKPSFFTMLERDCRELSFDWLFPNTSTNVWFEVEKQRREVDLTRYGRRFRRRDSYKTEILLNGDDIILIGLAITSPRSR